MKTQKSSIGHPSHHVPNEVAASLRNFREAELAELARRDEVAKLARPNEEERRLIAESAAKAGGVSDELLKIRGDVNKKRFNRVRDALERHAEIESRTIGNLLGHVPTFIPPVDHSFWWASTDWSFPEGVTADFRDDGLHFFGGVTHHSGDLLTTSFGALAYFELQGPRIPYSLTGLWFSAPHVELFGGLLGYTGDSDIFTGDLWSKCWMHRDQQLYQFGFGPDGPVPIILGQAHEVETLIFEENADRSVHVDLRGFQPMPAVTFAGVNIANSLWARLEVRFDIQVEGAGTLLWADPQVLLRTFQWPLNGV